MTEQPNIEALLEFDLSDRMRKSLDVSGMSVQAMADYLGVNRNTVSRWISGHIMPRRRAGISAPGEDPETVMFSPDYNEPRRLEKLADDLLRRGHSTGRVEKILGMNFARLFKEVWG